MHNAPAVTYPVGRSLFQGVMVAAAGGLGSLTLVVWWAGSAAPGWRQWLLAGVLLVAVLGAGAAWRRTPQGILRWDGHLWEWASSGTVQGGHLVVHLDFQFGMVMRLHSDRRPAVWLWPERRSQAWHWEALRRAAFARSGARHHQDSRGDPQRSRVKA